MQRPYYIVLSGAKKNVGDFLIEESALKLLNHIKPENNFIKYYYWDDLTPILTEVNMSKGIIFLGGPSYTRKMYPDDITLTKNLDDITVPIYTLGLGWKGIPGDKFTIKNLRFPNKTTKFIKKLSEFAPLSCRETHTYDNLSNQNHTNLILTGCPVMYDPSQIGKSFRIRNDIQKIVFTPAQNLIFHNQVLELMEMITNKFPEAIIYCSFHRGIEPDKYTTKKESEYLKIKAKKAESLGMKVIDSAYDTEKIEFYKSCDLHIGYRVHAHLFFLRNRIPSFLLHEDGRGAGFSKTLNLRGIDAYTRTWHSKLTEKTGLIPQIPYSHLFLNVIKPRKNTAHELKEYLSEEIENNFSQFKTLHVDIDSYYKTMHSHISENIK